MRKSSIFIAALVVAVVVPVGAASAGPSTVYSAEAVVTDEGQSVQSDGGGAYERSLQDGDTYVVLVDNARPSQSDAFHLVADAGGSSHRFLRLDIPDLAPRTDCADGFFRVFSKSDPNWLNGGGVDDAMFGRAVLYCNAGPQEPAYNITWGEGCVAITAVTADEFNFKPTTCAAKVKISQDGPPRTVQLSVPFDVTATRVV